MPLLLCHPLDGVGNVLAQLGRDGFAIDDACGHCPHLSGARSATLPGASDDRLPSRAPIVNYDMPEHNSFVKIKALTTIVTENTVRSWAIVFGWLKKF